SGTGEPFRLRLPIRFLSARAEAEHQVVVTMQEREQEFQIDLPFTPKHLAIEPERGYALVKRSPQSLEHSF
ncbi:MAG: hypothetical protein SNJ72_05345, partial [Fimbriimonadales bacterium]